MRICDHWSIKQGSILSPQAFNVGVHCPSLYFELLNLLSFDFNADPDPVFLSLTRIRIRIRNPENEKEKRKKSAET
jgi:hypothetical protein